ncbi:MAG: endonuclease/exonuclease/phosphatase family protein [Marinifilaceae bacterium]|jgi:endonuclease/exonuclease/phosphatase family metal-dependent hydrolase|nr:endonuclease/exonuclease/phosphatase family protein [Marinifilaceae bacterium]
MLRKILHKILVVICSFFILGLVLGSISQYVNPNSFGYLAFFGLAYPYLLVINIIFFFYWVYRKKKVFILPLLAILVSYPAFAKLISFGESNSEIITKSFKVLSYNVRYFNKYNWNKDPRTSYHIIDLINNKDPHIVCLQEFMYGHNRNISITTIKRKLKKYPYYYISKRRNLAIFSKYKIINKKELKISNSLSASVIYSDVLIGRSKLRIYNAHLESNRFSKDDYKFIKNITSSASGEQTVDGAKGIGKRLLHAFKIRAEQAKLIRRKVDASTLKSILCLDMNDTPLSYSYRILRGNYKDSFLEKSVGIGTTYIGDFPSFRIDYILYHPDLYCTDYERYKYKYSDHYPISASFKIDF